MLWAYFHFNQLTIDTGDQETRLLPAIVYEAGNNQVKQTNRRAQDAGVTPGMGMAQAAALCQSLHVIDYFEKSETQRLHAIANRLYQVASDIAVFVPDGLAIRLDPLIRYYDGLDNLWQTLVNELRQAGVTFNFGVAWSIEAAKVLAYHQHNQLLRAKSEIKKALSDCPLNATALTVKQQQTLQRVGIDSIARLLDVPATELGRRFDNKLITYLCSLKAEVFEKINFYHPPDTFESFIEPSYEISHTDRLLPYMQRLSDEFLTYARLRNMLTTSLHFTLHFREDAPMPVTVRAATALYKLAQWQSLIALKLEQLALSSPVINIALRVDELEEVDEQMSDFFDNRVHDFAYKQLISRLQTRLGESAIQFPSAGSDFRPEKLHHDRQTDTLNISSHPLPSIGLPQPKALREATQIEFGPVRIQTGWWDGAPVRRDYFIGRTDDGRRLHLFRDKSRQWFISGWYC
ncbi:Y-family DNA polymerase [Salinimonas chungwhensis]|uniref:Y-family DNA polymerase n=1 Tax=Salinimonas chungwhensis TaxID=265425 RepID=UPI000368512A|nr:DNA polymerase Y family protein [Salinimonas chungwhensis]